MVFVSIAAIGCLFLVLGLYFRLAWLFYLTKNNRVVRPLQNFINLVCGNNLGRQRCLYFNGEYYNSRERDFEFFEFLFSWFSIFLWIVFLLKI